MKRFLPGVGEPEECHWRVVLARVFLNQALGSETLSSAAELQRLDKLEIVPASLSDACDYFQTTGRRACARAGRGWLLALGLPSLLG